MEIKYHKDATDFLASTGKYLAQDEARYGNLLGMAKAAIRHSELLHIETLWCSVCTRNKINAVALSIIDRMVMMECISGDRKVIAEKLVEMVEENFQNISGVAGEKLLVDIFSEKLCQSQKMKIKHSMEQKLFRFDTVNDVPISPGKFRPATMADKELFLKWQHAFHVDVRGEASTGWEARILPALEQGWVFFWELGGKPVSMATKARPTDKGMTVIGVYTPPELRGKGYATSCVAELSRNILRSGKEFCILYTDLANPTSNSIYKKIGYKEVGDSVWCTFEKRKK